MGRVQVLPTASVPGDEEVELTCGQAVPPLLFQVKLAAMLGSKPLEGTGRLSAALPTFSIVTVCGLSLLVAPTAVEAKLRLGASA